METSAKVNEGVEEAFFSLARCVLKCCSTTAHSGCHAICILTFPPASDIKARLIDTQGEPAAGGPAQDSVKVNEPAAQGAAGGCC